MAPRKPVPATDSVDACVLETYWNPISRHGTYMYHVTLPWSPTQTTKPQTAMSVKKKSSEQFHYPTVLLLCMRQAHTALCFA